MRFQARSAVLLGLCLSTSTWAEDDSKPIPEPNLEPPKESGSTWELMSVQAALLDAADTLKEAAADASGYSTIELDVPNRTVLLFWKSSEPVSDEVSKVLELLLSTGVSVAVVPAAFSERELLAEQSSLLEAATKESLPLISLAPLHGGGLRLTVPWDAVELTLQSDAVADATARLQEIASTDDAAGVVVEAGDEILLSSREADSSPWWSGAVVSTPLGVCSSGFAAGNVWGKYMLLAGHCVNGNQVPVANGAGTPMGLSAGFDEAYDVARVQVPNVQGRMWDGGIGNSAFQKPVVGSGANFVGQLICTSGAFSGAICDIRVTGLQEIIIADGIVMIDMVRAEQIDGLSASGKGDSGGPVFSLSANFSSVYARGLMSAISAGTRLAACTGDVNRICSSEVFYSEINTSKREQDVWIELVP